MKAWILNGIGDISYEDISVMPPDEGEVLIRVRAAGICGSDVPRTYDTGAHKHPLIIGHEFSGEVADIGRGVSKEWDGKCAGVFPLIPCCKCDQCRLGSYEMCRHYDYVGSRRDGAFAQFVRVPAKNLIELPPEASFEEAAMLEPMAVAVHAIRKGTDEFSLDKNALIAVCGLGTIGLLAAMFLQEAGYDNLCLIGNKMLQKKLAVDLGIDKSRVFIQHTGQSANPESDALKDEATDPVSCLAREGGAALFFECVGKNECLSLGVDVLRPAGCLVCVGNPASNMTLERNVYWKILRSQLTLMGTWNSSFTYREEHKYQSDDNRKANTADIDDWQYVLRKLAEGSIHPSKLITHRLQLAELERGLLLMRDKTEEYCKVMVQI
ncbi:MAG: galactitol-1-phosphate 5-dehydrogenase [Lachnospiraceae bacterium]|nr:galactitol-1-phosphate 5-dehydrogenase [Lachnospiraceae bacterium]